VEFEYFTGGSSGGAAIDWLSILILDVGVSDVEAAEESRVAC
jgi:hypothetical protein